MGNFNCWHSDSVRVLAITPVSKRAWHDLPSTFTSNSLDGPTTGITPRPGSSLPLFTSLRVTSSDSTGIFTLELSPFSDTTLLSTLVGLLANVRCCPTLTLAFIHFPRLNYQQTPLYQHSGLPRLCPMIPQSKHFPLKGRQLLTTGGTTVAETGAVGCGTPMGKGLSP